MALFGRRSRGEPTRLFFASDLHGSQPAWRKFVNAAAVYEVDGLIFGGDLMGKATVPIVDDGAGRYRAELQDEAHVLDGAGELSAFRRSIEVAGFYSVVLDPDEHACLQQDPLAVAGLFDRLARARLSSWIELARERLSGTGVRCYLTGGNDDTPGVLEALEEADGETVVSAEGKVVDLDGRHCMITVGYSTPTPWDTPREVGEDEMASAIEASVSRVPDPGLSVFNFHAPPKDTPIDRCVKLEQDHLSPGELPRPVRIGQQVAYTGGGSVAVREAVATHQPVVSLHGHIHESPGRLRLGRTQCFNPGSEYGQGVLDGVILAIRDGRLTGYQHTSG